MFKAYLKQFFIVVICAICAVSLSAQTAAISGTITDANGQAYANGTYTITFRPVPGNPGPYYQKGTTTPFTESFSGLLDSNGSFSGVTLQRNDYISPAQTSWTFKVCSQASAPCYSINLVIAASSVDISTLVTPPAIQVSPGALQLAYSDSEIIPSGLGSEYSNLTDNSIHYCTAVSGNSCSSWSIAANSENPVIQNLTSIHPGITPTSIEQVEYADQFSGADIGAQVNAAIAALPGGCGTVVIPAASTAYPYSTTIIKPRCVLLEGNGGGETGISGKLGTTLEWTGSSGVAVAIGDSSGPSSYPGGGISNLTIEGPTGGNTAVGLWLGGDPTGTVLPSGDYADAQRFYNLRIITFGTGIEWGNNAWLDNFFSVSIEGGLGAVGITASVGITNSNEQNVFFGGAIFSNEGGAIVNASALDLHFIGTSLDFDNGCTNAPCTTPAIANTQVDLTDVHIEQNAGPAIYNETADTENRIFGGSITLDSTASGTDACLICVTGVAPDLTINGTDLYSGHTVTNAVDFTSSNGGGSLVIRNPLGGINNFMAMYPSALQSSYYTDVSAPLARQETIIPGSTVKMNGSLQINTTQGVLELSDITPSAPTPNKYWRVDSGKLEMCNSAYSACGFTIDDSFNLSANNIAGDNATFTTVAIGGGTALTTSNQTGTGNIVLATSPSITSPTLTGITTAATLNATAVEQGSQAVALSGANGLSAGTITISSATSGAHTFTTAYDSAPVCVASENSTTPTALVFGVTSSTTVVTITLSTSGSGTFTWSCSPAVN